MLFLSSYPQRSEKIKNKIKQNIRFILSHFKEPIFPRTISSRSTTCAGTQFKVVYNEKEMFKAYEQFEFIDCRVSVYRSSYATQECHHTHENQVADLITFNVCKPIFMRKCSDKSIICNFASNQANIKWQTNYPEVHRFVSYLPTDRTASIRTDKKIYRSHY